MLVELSATRTFSEGLRNGWLLLRSGLIYRFTSRWIDRYNEKRVDCCWGKPRPRCILRPWVVGRVSTSVFQRPYLIFYSFFVFLVIRRCPWFPPRVSRSLPCRAETWGGRYTATWIPATRMREMLPPVVTRPLRNEPSVNTRLGRVFTTRPIQNWLAGPWLGKGFFSRTTII